MLSCGLSFRFRLDVRAHPRALLGLGLGVTSVVVTVQLPIYLLESRLRAPRMMTECLNFRPYLVPHHFQCGCPEWFCCHKSPSNRPFKDRNQLFWKRSYIHLRAVKQECQGLGHSFPLERRWRTITVGGSRPLQGRVRCPLERRTLGRFRSAGCGYDQTESRRLIVPPSVANPRL